MKKRKKYKKRRRGLNGTDTRQTTVAKVKSSAIHTGKDLLIGVIGGGIAGAVIGKPSLIIGAGVTGFGHYANKPALTTFGIGMMASSGITAQATGTHGVDGFSKEDIKARVMSFKDSIASKLFLDKIIKKKNAGKTESDTNGIGAVQYFTYPDPNKELDFSALNRLEQQVNKSGADYQKSIKGTDEEDATMQGDEDDTTVQGDADELDFSGTSY